MKNFDFFNETENNQNLKISKISKKFSKKDTNEIKFEKKSHKINNEIQNSQKIAQNGKLQKN